MCFELINCVKSFLFSQSHILHFIDNDACVDNIACIIINEVQYMTLGFCRNQKVQKKRKKKKKKRKNGTLNGSIEKREQKSKRSPPLKRKGPPTKREREREREKEREEEEEEE